MIATTMATGPIHYFAYGSNLDRARMRKRCPDATPVGRAMLRGYRLAFAGSSSTWGGCAVATLLPARGAFTSGVLYQLSPESLAVLDGCEGHPDVYQRVRVCVGDEWGRRRFAQAYCLPANATPGVPSLAYVRLLRRAYDRLGFGAHTIEQALRAVWSAAS